MSGAVTSSDGGETIARMPYDSVNHLVTCDHCGVTVPWRTHFSSGLPEGWVEDNRQSGLRRLPPRRFYCPEHAWRATAPL